MSVMPATGSAALRLGFVPALNPHAGGVFQYLATMQAALTAIASDGDWLAPVALLPENVPDVDARFAADGWTATTLAPPVGGVRGALGRIVGQGPHRDALRRVRQWMRAGADSGSSAADPSATLRRNDVAQWWRRHGIALTLFPQPHPLAFEAGLPFVVAVHDLQHRLQPEFREVSANGEWGRREYILRNCISRAERVLVDSDVGKDDVLSFYEGYGARADRIDVLPFVSPSAHAGEVSEARRREVRARHRIPDRYVLYPAAFWPHKNHARIIEAIERLARTKQLRVDVVFCGSRGDAERDEQFSLLMQMAAQCGVMDQVHVPGYVSADELAALYAGATALVMPTFFGPTNIPVIEAWAHGCPVLTSDIPGIREQVGDAAILADPRAVDAIAAGIERIVTDADLRRGLAARGTRRLAAHTPGQFQDRLLETLRRASAGHPASLAPAHA